MNPTTRIWMAACLLLTASSVHATEKPNILFLFTDDQRPDTIHALGNETIITPALDSLARRGMVFNNAYNMGSICAPSRNSLFSGRSQFRYHRYASEKKPNIPQSMNEAGYETYMRCKDGRAGALLIHEHFQHGKYLQHHMAHKNGQPGKIPVDDAIEFLEARSTEKPFFVYLGFSEPHDPRNPADEYLDMYDRDEIPLPRNYMPLHPFDAGMLTIRDEQLELWPRTEDKVRRHIHEYYGMITGLDHHIGRLLQKLKDLGQYDNTIIVFSSDHGLAVGSHGLIGKANCYAHTAKTPLIIAGPGIPKGRSDALVSLLDLFPTFCEMVGAPVPEGLDGVSIKPILDGKAKKVREHVFACYGDVQRAVRVGDWKLVRFPKINKTLLFNLKDDPDELDNLADSKDQAKRVESMMALLEREQRRLGDKLSLTSENPLPEEITAEQIQKRVDQLYENKRIRAAKAAGIPLEEQPPITNTMYQRELDKQAYMDARKEKARGK